MESRRRPPRESVTGEEGQPLSFAWSDFATKEVRREYQACEIDSRRMSHRLDMKFDLLDAAADSPSSSSSLAATGPSKTARHDEAVHESE